MVFNFKKLSNFILIIGLALCWNIVHADPTKSITQKRNIEINKAVGGFWGAFVGTKTILYFNKSTSPTKTIETNSIDAADYYNDELIKEQLKIAEDLIVFIDLQFFCLDNCEAMTILLTIPDNNGQTKPQEFTLRNFYVNYAYLCKRYKMPFPEQSKNYKLALQYQQPTDTDLNQFVSGLSRSKEGILKKTKGLGIAARSFDNSLNELMGAVPNFNGKIDKDNPILGDKWRLLDSASEGERYKAILNALRAYFNSKSHRCPLKTSISSFDEEEYMKTGKSQYFEIDTLWPWLGSQHNIDCTTTAKTSNTEINADLIKEWTDNLKILQEIVEKLNTNQLDKEVKLFFNNLKDVIQSN